MFRGFHALRVQRHKAHRRFRQLAAVVAHQRAGIDQQGLSDTDFGTDLVVMSVTDDIVYLFLRQYPRLVQVVNRENYLDFLALPVVSA